jgi:predicted metalloendopeptidase
MHAMELRFWVAMWVLTACSGPADRPVPPNQPPAPPAWQLDRSSFDPAVRPCADFYQHVCGGFAAKAEIPAGQGSVSMQRGAAEASIARILEDILAGPGAADPEVSRLRTFYASCMKPDGDSRS